ncbi:hypothetical protein PTW37_08700 [Arthrobacter agilis]|uniref:hypothetical protein n=1 Tax=Arthrobacter agilis TaxID=37921 RepID=UPI002366C261|nr:hypothetical protein [Arthrobacter agilis]WDF31971.1 hypothetical protein PTW37_08700 [Arthrobacter agilis]
MGNEHDDADYRVRDGGGVQIIDVGDPTPNESAIGIRSRLGLSARKRFALGGTLMVGIFGGLTLLPSMNDGPPPEQVEKPLQAVSACQAIKQSQQREAAALEGQGEESPVNKLPPGYSLYGVMTSNTSTSLIGIVHPDGSLQICEEAAHGAPYAVRFPSEANLSQLPDGMTYAYDSSTSFTDNTLTLQLEGVRLADGTIMKSLTLPNGKTVPATPASIP